MMHEDGWLGGFGHWGFEAFIWIVVILLIVALVKYIFTNKD